MKLIDKRGKLFGKLNIIDGLVLVLIVVAAAMVGYKLLQQDGAGHIEGTVQRNKLTYTVMVSSMTPVIYQEICTYLPGDQLMASGEMLDGYIVDISAEPALKYNTNDQGITYVTTEQGEHARYDVTFTIEAVPSNAMTNEVGTQEVRVGRTHIVKTLNFEITGIVQTCEWSE